MRCSSSCRGMGVDDSDLAGLAAVAIHPLQAVRQLAVRPQSGGDDIQQTYCYVFYVMYVHHLNERAIGKSMKYSILFCCALVYKYKVKIIVTGGSELSVCTVQNNNK